MQCGADHHRTIVISGKPFRTVGAHCWDVARRLEEMDAEGVRQQVLSPMPELLSYWFGLDDALAFGRHVNGTIASMVAAGGGRFHGLGMVPLQYPERAAREVRSLRHEFGMLGVEIGSNINGLSLGDRCFDSFYAALQEEDMCLFVHALHPVKARLSGPPLMEALVAFPNETALAITSLIVSGVQARFPRLRIAFSHGGGSFPMILPRLQHGWSTSEQLQEAIPRSPEEQARAFWYDTLVYSEPALAYLIQAFGLSRLMVGTDYPFAIREPFPARRIDGLGLGAPEREALLSGNARRFLGV
jgi:aminocarboxymuconate-semialdehyde decarboxylase